jgi:6-phosphogluconolactonase
VQHDIVDFAAARYLLVGGFTPTPGAARIGDQPDSGLTLFADRSGRWQRCDSSTLANPTWAAWSRRHRRFYVSHSAMRELSAVSIHMLGDHAATGARGWDGSSLTCVDRVDIGAVNPVHIALDTAERHVLAACFGAGEIVAAGLADDGQFTGVSDRWRAYEGVVGATADDSEPHQVVWWPKHGCYVVPDRGLHAVHTVQFDSRTGKFGARRTFPMRPGSGPRHLVVGRGGDLLYLGNELDSTVSVLRWTGEVLTEAFSISSLPVAWAGRSVIGAVFQSPDRRRVFVTNRGAESIAMFDVDTDPARPALIDWIRLRGAHARFAAYLPEPAGLVVAFKDSDRIEFLDDPHLPRRHPAPVDLPYEQPAFVTAFGTGAP